ncbi:hypothetical protein SAMN02745165_03549 [Malonomonas rubra DSM 5091]|uniref:TniQ protein n=1 Tax=Malonomonas rubra DSM 5091 TaxID=1122189 RepID=A0A1M6NA62_MALRU|nr:hypothetical protein [Malonomonas rubra]SHJ92571.1 hypothetical protein SAMN02745165_03549 [Malonomonas rubra DSM 5091]
MKKGLVALAREKRTFCINPTLYLPTESIWSALNKGMLLNQCRLRVYLEPLANVSYPTLVLKYSKYDLYRQDALNIERFSQLTGLNPEKYINSKLVGLMKDQGVGSEILRFCPKCTTFGFHSNLHQIKTIGECPFHKEKIINKCMSCGKNIEYTFADLSKRQPYFCSYCNSPLSVKVKSRDLAIQKKDISIIFSQHEEHYAKLFKSTLNCFNYQNWKIKTLKNKSVSIKEKIIFKSWRSLDKESKSEISNIDYYTQNNHN